jgi:hypothetical protein
MLAAMDLWEQDGRRFEVMMASDVIRDGMSLELTDLDDERGPGPHLEVFYSDADHTMLFSAMRPITVPLETVARFIESARRSLPPSQ